MFLDTVTLHNLLAWGLKAIKGGKIAQIGVPRVIAKMKLEMPTGKGGFPSIEKGTTVENISQFWVTSDQLHLQVGIHVISKVGRVLTKC